MKHLKGKLLASVAMLVVASIMVSAASFAWLTISTKPEITGLKTTVETNQNFEIALAKSAASSKTDKPAESTDSDSGSKGADYTWGNIINLSGTTNDAEVAFGKLIAGNAATIRPCYLSKSKFYAPEYGDDGRVKDADKTELVYTAQENGMGILYANNDGTDGYASGGKDVVYGYYLDFWIRSNVGGPVILQQTGADRGNGKSGSGTSFTVINDTDYGKATTELQSAYNNLAESIRVSFAEVTPSDNSVGTITSMTTKATKGIATIGLDKDSKAETIYTLKANTEVLVRMIITFDITKIKNYATSNKQYNTNKYDEIKMTGSFNLQFSIDEVKTPYSNISQS